jgi:hypothetical protein
MEWVIDFGNFGKNLNPGGVSSFQRLTVSGLGME